MSKFASLRARALVAFVLMDVVVLKVLRIIALQLWKWANMIVSNV